MNPKYIKFLAGYAAGYEIINPDDPDMILRCPDGVEFYLFDFFEKEAVYYSDFLQKAIEGINRETKYIIEQCNYGILLKKQHSLYSRQMHFDKYKIDEAKNITLEYVWKRESEL